MKIRKNSFVYITIIITLSIFLSMLLNNLQLGINMSKYHREKQSYLSKNKNVKKYTIITYNEDTSLAANCNVYKEVELVKDNITIKLTEVKCENI